MTGWQGSYAGQGGQQEHWRRALSVQRSQPCGHLEEEGSRWRQWRGLRRADFPGGGVVKNSTALQGTWVQSLV